MLKHIMVCFCVQVCVCVHTRSHACVYVYSSTTAVIDKAQYHTHYYLLYLLHHSLPITFLPCNQEEDGH